MKYAEFNKYKSIIANLTDSEITDLGILHKKLKVEGDTKICNVYTPFEYVNPDAKIALVGITPGNTQLVNAVREIRRCIRDGLSDEECLISAKKTAAFSGGMRSNLIKMLNSIGVHKYLGINDCKQLFAGKNHLVQTCSAIKNATYAYGGGKWNPYNGTKGGGIDTNVLLVKWVLASFGEQAKSLSSNMLYLPLGPVAERGIKLLVRNGVIKDSQILEALPHPSGANNERIAFFLGEKTGSSLRCGPEVIAEYQIRRRRLESRLENM